MLKNKLNNLEVTKVAFVPAGDNPQAELMIFKSKPEEPKADTSEKGIAKKIFSAIAKALGLGEKDVEEIIKGEDAETFGEKMAEREMWKVTDQMWDTTYALRESLVSILLDSEVAQELKAGLMQQSLNEFVVAVNGLIPTWANGKTVEEVAKSDRPITPERISLAKAAIAKLEEIVAKETIEPVGKSEELKGESEDMKIDKSKLTPEEVAMYDSICKKAGTAEPENIIVTAVDVLKGEPLKPIPAVSDTEDIYKGLHPAVKAELENLHKSVEAAEDKEMLEVAKKYEIIGKKPEEFASVLKNLKKTDATAYGQMISVLDASVDAVEKSGLFSEIGKRGAGEANAWSAIEKHADEIQKSMPDATRSQAIDKACEQHPELVHQYESNR